VSAKDESAVLGWWMLKPSEALTSSLTPDHFVTPRNRQLCIAMQRRGWTTADLGVAVGPDWTNCAVELDEAARFENPTTIESATARLHENFAAKASEVAAVAFLDRVRRRVSPISELIQGHVRALAEAEAMTPSRSRSHREVATELFADWCESIANPEKAATLPLPWPELHTHTGGWVIGKLHLIGGRSSEHKTTVARACAAHLASLGIPVAYHTAEDSDRDISGRTLADASRLLDTRSLMLGNVPYDRGGITEDELSEIMGDVQRSIESEVGEHLHIVDDPNPTLSSLLTTIKAEAARGCRAFFFDFLQLIRPDKGQPTNDWWRECVASLAGLAKQLQIVLVCTSQIEKTGTQASAGENRIPRADEMPFGAVVRQGAFACLMVGTRVDEGGLRLAIEVDKWKSAENLRSNDKGARFVFDVDPAHDRLTERKRK
jgi:replicative DNA helicase